MCSICKDNIGGAREEQINTEQSEDQCLIDSCIIYMLNSNENVVKLKGLSLNWSVWVVRFTDMILVRK